MNDNIFDELNGIWNCFNQDHASRISALTAEDRARIERIVTSFATGYSELNSGMQSFLEQLQSLQEEEANIERKQMVLLAFDAVQLQLTQSAISRASDAFGRAFQLALMIRPEYSSPRTKSFFGNVSRSYLNGFAHETVVMCRAAVEAELVAEISNDDCLDVLGPRNNQWFELRDRIRVATKTQRLTPEGALGADEVREAGNRAIHGNPSRTKLDDALHIIQVCLSVLRELDATRA